MALLNRLSALSGAMEFQASIGEKGNQLAISERHIEEFAESAELAQTFRSSGLDASASSLDCILS
jgi:hypothetical protein